MAGLLRSCLVGLVCLALLMAAGPAAAEKDKYHGPVMKVNGQAALEFAPDMVELTVGVVTRAPTAQEAAAENATAMTRVSQALQKALAGQGSLRTVGYRVRAVYEWDRKAKRNRFVAFEATNRVKVRSKDVKGAGALLDAAIKAGANKINGPVWSLAEPAAAYSQAQVAALKHAQAQAGALAQAAGLKLGKIISIRAGRGRQPRQPFMALKAPAPNATPLEPGSITIEASVTCVFALEPAKP